MRIYLAGNPGGGSKLREREIIKLYNFRLISYYDMNSYGNFVLELIITRKNK
jgi:hypothetical protein